MMQGANDLVDGFDAYLEGLRADTPDLGAEAYRLRYRIYCEERGFENPSDFQDGLERDEYDARAVQVLVRHRGSGQMAGVARLVRPDPGGVFPIEAHCGDWLDMEAASRVIGDRGSVAEVSRFAVLRDFKRRRGESETVAGVSDLLGYDNPGPGDGRRFFPHIALGLLGLLFARSSELGIRSWFALFEPSTIRLFSRFGLAFTPIGRLVDYHGRRQPVVADLAQLREGMERVRPDYGVFLESIAKNTSVLPGQMAS